MKAVAIWNPDKKSKYSDSFIKMKGFVLFIQKEECVKVNIFIEGLEDGNHGIHIHEKGVSEVINLGSANCCDELGGHYNSEESWSLENPLGIRHGEHSGDMCLNINSSNGIATYTYYDKKINVEEIIGRSVVIHEDEDDGGKGLYIEEEQNIQSLITGNAGKRLGCAEIRLILDENF
jgi:Cu-Zn family superoxide dismutase